jgi:hypothetical protein
MNRAADTGAVVSVAAVPQRPGWLCVVVERPKRTRRLWLAIDEAAQLRAGLDAVLPPVESTRRPG